MTNLTITAYESLLRQNPDLHGPDLPKPKRGHAPTEHEEQAAVIAWARNSLSTYPELQLLSAIPNGGYRDKHTAAMLKKEGVQAGFPDLLLPAMRRDGQHVYGALFVEMKRRDYSNNLSPEQGAFVGALRRAGYCVVVAYGAEEAIRAIVGYLGLQGI